MKGAFQIFAFPGQLYIMRTMLNNRRAPFAIHIVSGFLYQCRLLKI